MSGSPWRLTWMETYFDNLSPTLYTQNIFFTRNHNYCSTFKRKPLYHRSNISTYILNFANGSVTCMWFNIFTPCLRWWQFETIQILSSERTSKHNSHKPPLPLTRFVCCSKLCFAVLILIITNYSQLFTLATNN